MNVTKDWKFDFDYTYASETGVIKRPGARYSAANAWMAGTLKTDAAGNQIYVNDLGQQVAATAEGAMPAYELPYQSTRLTAPTPTTFIENLREPVAILSMPQQIITGN